MVEDLFYGFFSLQDFMGSTLSQRPLLGCNSSSFQGPALHVHHGDTIYVTVHNKGRYNITIHWHGVKLPGYPWSDGPEYITQCPIKPGGKFRQKIIFSTEEGTLWWHAHSDWSRATVHGIEHTVTNEEKRVARSPRKISSRCRSSTRSAADRVRILFEFEFVN
ncbi:hypothetical protein DKX38_008277 [Salix brachista]|uniref:Plastocyanin-like domain-containing protein n=1 Tax=Salix brachista TaxID=2182728 RepID=A0A5N5MR23_9ROSI|nr:hypothetical protein DKX38_008277 [Salix brachista]